MFCFAPATKPIALPTLPEKGERELIWGCEIWWNFNRKNAIIDFVKSGCSISAVRMHGVHVGRVRFPAPRRDDGIERID